MSDFLVRRSDLRASDPFYSDGTEGLQMLLRPLFYTSFLIDDVLDEGGSTERGPILISSASSKTAIAAAFLLAQRPGVEIIGLTSKRSREFVERLEIYSATVTYDEVAPLGVAPSVFIDVPGPTPRFFFAPDRVTERSRYWGRSGLNDRVAGAWHPFCD